MHAAPFGPRRRGPSLVLAGLVLLGTAAARAEPTPVAAPAPLILPEPARLPRADRTRLGPSPGYYTGRQPLVRPVFRVAPGFSARVHGDRVAAFTLDVAGGVALGVRPGSDGQWGLLPEVGYSLRTPRTENALTAGLGLVHGITASRPTFGLIPRLVWAPRAAATLGLRAGLFCNFAENGFSVELAYQAMWRGPVAVHEVRLTAGVDLAMLVAAFAVRPKPRWLR